MPKTPRPKPPNGRSNEGADLITDHESLLRALAERPEGPFRLHPEAAAAIDSLVADAQAHGLPVALVNADGSVARSWDDLWDALPAGDEETVQLPLIKAEPGTQFYHRSIEGILNVVTEVGETTERRGRTTPVVDRRFPGGDAVLLCVPHHRTPEKAEQCARAVRVLQKVAGQCADAKRRRGPKSKGIWLTPEEVEVWNDLLRHQPTLQFNCYNPETHEREAHPRREGQVAGANWPHPEAVFHMSLCLAAQFLADVVYERVGYRVRRCRAPLHPTKTEDKAICGRLFVTATQGEVGRTCGTRCRRRVADRKKALAKKTQEAANKEAYEELLRQRHEELNRQKG